VRVTGMGWAGVIAAQYEANRQFYAERIGLPLQFEAKKHVISHFRLPSGQLLELYGPGNRQRRPEKFRWFDGPALGFEVEDLESAREEMISRGATFILGIETWKEEAWSMFLGPEDTLLQIQTVGRHAPERHSQLLAFSWSAVVVTDFDAAARFFSELMDMPTSWRDDRQTSARFSLPDGHLFEILGRNHPWNEFLKQTTIGFEVESVERVRREMIGRGVEFIGDVETREDGHRFTFFRDLDGHVYALWAPVKIAGG